MIMDQLSINREKIEGDKREIKELETKIELYLQVSNIIATANGTLPLQIAIKALGLSGEIRPVNRIEQRIQEAEKLGFSTIFVSKYNKI